MVALQPAGVIACRASDGTPAWRVELAADRALSADDELIYTSAPESIRALRLTSGEEAWRTETGQLTAAPLIHSGWIVVASVGSLGAFRATDGSAVWRRSLGTIEATPVIDGDLLIVPLMDGGLVALHLQTGETRWETDLGGRPGAPLAAGGKVYVGASDKHFYALDADNGDIEWSFRVGAAPRGRAAADDDHVYFVALDNVLRALDRGNGAIRWAKGLPYRPGPSGPVLIGSALVVPGDVTTFPVFGRDGTPLTDIKFSSTLVGISNVTADRWNHPVVGVITGDLEHPWTLWLLETSTDPPAVPIVPLTAMPGEAIAIALPQ